MYIGRGTKPSKTEWIFFPPPGFFKPSNYYSPAVDINSYQITTPVKKENEKQKKWEGKEYEEAN